MPVLVPSLFVSLTLVVSPVETRFVEVSPAPKQAASWERSAGVQRAVVLIHGLRPHVRNDTVGKAGFQDWQRPGSTLVKALAKEADVYAFAYGQNVAVDVIAGAPELRTGVQRLKKLGYEDIVLIGHSAGGVVARQFVEDFSDTGVTKVIQVCAPNGGCALSNAAVAVPKSQAVFVHSLTKEACLRRLKERSNKKVPDGVQFVCLVGNAAGTGDGVISCRCQWTEDLQKQGIRAVAFSTMHFGAMRSHASAEKIADLVRRPQSRWSESQIASVREKLFHEVRSMP